MENPRKPVVKSIPTFARFGQLIFEIGMHSSGTCCILNTVRRTETEKQKTSSLQNRFFSSRNILFLSLPLRDAPQFWKMT